MCASQEWLWFSKEINLSELTTKFSLNLKKVIVSWQIKLFTNLLFETLKRQDNIIDSSRIVWFEKLAFIVLILNHKTSASVGTYMPL